MVCGGVRGIGPVCGESGPGPNLAVPPCEFSSVRTRSLSLSIRFSWCVPALLRRPLSAAGTPRTPPSTGSRRAYMASALLYPINRIRYAKSAFKKMGPHGVGERLHACTTMKPAPATRTPRTTPRSESNHRPAVIGQTKNYARHIRTHIRVRVESSAKLELCAHTHTQGRLGVSPSLTASPLPPGPSARR